MRIIGIDPGYDRLGIAVIEKSGKGKESLLYSTCFQTSAKDDIYIRLAQVGAEVSRILEEYAPDALSIENLYITKNQKTAMRVSEARGIILYEAAKRHIPIHEYTPMEIKVAVTGDGSSDKRMVEKMVGLLLKLPPKKALDDECDAIAAALAHSAVAR
jgi:crossover junction endodeoxyribonuclease RuvC